MRQSTPRRLFVVASEVSEPERIAPITPVVASCAPSLLHSLVKRVIDIVAATALLAALSPLFAVIAVAVRGTSKGPVLFRQRRLGRHGNEFTMLKFRSMYYDTPDDIHRNYVRQLLVHPGSVTPRDGVYKLADDPRVTPIGRLLRRTSLDELPQLFNVLTGTMTLVGPRPVLAYEAELFAPHHRVRFDVAPGITGLWQVSGRSSLSMLDALELDVDYVRRQSLLLDLRILARTIPALLALGRSR